MSEATLRPCPFCGNAYPNVVRWDESGEPRWRVVCLNCLHSNVFSEPEAITAWNRAARVAAGAGDPSAACPRCGGAEWVCASCNRIVTGEAAAAIAREIREGTPDTPERIATMKRADEAFARSGFAERLGAVRPTPRAAPSECQCVARTVLHESFCPCAGAASPAAAPPPEEP